MNSDPRHLRSARVAAKTWPLAAVLAGAIACSVPKPDYDRLLSMPRGAQFDSAIAVMSDTAQVAIYLYSEEGGPLNLMVYGAIVRSDLRVARYLADRVRETPTGERGELLRLLGAGVLCALRESHKVDTVALVEALRPPRPDRTVGNIVAAEAVRGDCRSALNFAAEGT